MPMVTGRVLQTVLEYLYTGRCLFPPDDLNLGIEVWRMGEWGLVLCVCVCVCLIRVKKRERERVVGNEV